MKKMTKVIATACAVLTMATSAAISTSAFAAENNDATTTSVSSSVKNYISVEDLPRLIKELQTESYNINTQLRSISAEIGAYKPTDPKRVELEAQKAALIAKLDSIKSTLEKYQKAEEIGVPLQELRRDVYSICTKMRLIAMAIAEYRDPTDPRRVELEAQMDACRKQTDEINAKIAEYQKMVDEILGNI